ncbi:MAG: transcriptional regulator MraZ [Candidatus Hydrogenedentes bacterium]|nr:transcriptional regulator MraZ [Candidatus Hydrogenedentota bacterium]
MSRERRNHCARLASKQGLSGQTFFHRFRLYPTCCSLINWIHHILILVCRLTSCPIGVCAKQGLTSGVGSGTIGRRWEENRCKVVAEDSGMYIGTAETVLDSKNRITVPVRVRETMHVLDHSTWYMTRGFDGGIFLFPRSEWDKIRGVVSRYSAMDARVLDYRRLLFASVTEVQPDRQGRMPVPAHLREYAGLDRDAVLIGVGDYMELWDRDAWWAFQKKQEPDFKAMAAQFFARNAEEGQSTREGGASNEIRTN